MLPRLANRIIDVIRNEDSGGLAILIVLNKLSDEESWGKAGGHYFLLEALKKSTADVVMLLLNSGCSVVKLSCKRKVQKLCHPCDVPLNCLIENSKVTLEGKLELIDLLLKKGVNINDIDATGRHALHIAATMGMEEIIERLLLRGADIDVVDGSKRTALSIAVTSQQLKAVEVLIAHNASVERAKVGSDLLKVAVMNGNDGITECLLQQQAFSNDVRQKEGETLLILAIKNCLNVRIVELLLKHGARVDAKDEEGKSCLYLAVMTGEKEFVAYVLAKNPDKADRSNLDAFRVAVIEARNDIVHIFMQYNYDVCPYDKENSELLYGAIKMGHFQIIESLLKFGTDINRVRTLKLQTSRIVKTVTGLLEEIKFNEELVILPINAAIEFKNLKIIKLLLKYGALVDPIETVVKTPLHLAVESENIKIVRCILKKRPDKNDRGNRIALNSAVVNGSTCIVKELLRYGFIVCLDGKDNNDVLYASIKNDYLKVVEHFLQHELELNNLFPLKNGGEFIPVHVATEFQRWDILRILLEFGAKFEFEDSRGQTAFVYAVRLGNQKCIEMLMKSETSRTTAAAARKKIWEGIVKVIAMEPVASVYDIFLADVARLLLSKGESVSYMVQVEVTSPRLPFEKQSPQKFSTLHMVAKYGYAISIGVFLQNGADANLIDRTMSTPLHYSVKNSHDDVSKILLSENIDINAKDVLGQTALHLAAESPRGFRSRKFIELLLRNGAGIDIKDKEGRTSLYKAVSNVNIDAVKVLLNNSTPVCIATECVTKALLCHEANVNERYDVATTPLSIACERDSIELVHILLKFGGDINDIDIFNYQPSGSTLLLNAIFENVCAGYAEDDFDNGGYDGFDPYDDYDQFYASDDDWDVDEYEDYNDLFEDDDSDDNWVDIGECENADDSDGNSRNDDLSIHPQPYLETPVDLFDYIVSNDKYYTSQCSTLFDILVRHVIKLKTAGLYVSKRNLENFEELSESDKMVNAVMECEKEIEKLKSEEIGGSTVTFFNFLHKNPSQIATFLASNDVLLHGLDWNSIYSKFPIYSDLLRSKFKYGKSRMELLSRMNSNWCKMFPRLSYYCIQNLLEYFANEDLMVLVDVFQAQHLT